MRFLALALVFVSIGINACAQEEVASFKVVNHCDFYRANTPIHRVLREADFAAAIVQVADQSPIAFDQVRFKTVDHFYGDERSEFDLFVGLPSDDGQYADEIQDRIALHSSQAFLWSYVSKPSPAAYTGESAQDCNIVPVSIPGQRYIVALKGQRILAFEPIPNENSTLAPWFDYYGTIVRPSETQ